MAQNTDPTDSGASEETGVTNKTFVLPQSYYKLKSRNLSLSQRFRIWRLGVIEAISTKPPKSVYDFVECEKHRASFESHWIKGPRYEMKDGKWERAGPTDDA